MSTKQYTLRDVRLSQQPFPAWSGLHIVPNIDFNPAD
jgi:hypothetical protein